MTDFANIDAQRRAAGMTVAGLCRKARVPISTYWRIAKRRNKQWRGATVEKFQVALASSTAAPPPGTPKARRDDGSLILSLYRAYAALIAREIGADASSVLASDPSLRATSSPEWQAAARIRALAVYCVSIELSVPAARVAVAIGVTRQAASLMLRRVEDFRDDPEIDALVERVGKLVSGRT